MRRFRYRNAITIIIQLAMTRNNKLTKKIVGSLLSLFGTLLDVLDE